MKFVLAGFLGLIALEQHYAATLVAGCEVVARLVKFDCRYYVGLCDVLNVAFVTKASVTRDVSALS